MNFVYKSEKIAFLISDEVVAKYYSYIETYDFRIESGGIIAGQLNPAENQILATDITEPCEKDKCSAFSFKRSECGHQKIMNDLWERSGHTKTYLGEWHTHNQKSPQPSYIDIRNWIHISKRQQNSRWLFFIIVGTEEIGVWNVENGKVIKMVNDNKPAGGCAFEQTSR